MGDNDNKGHGYNQDPNPEHGRDDNGHNGNHGEDHGHEKKPTVPHALICVKN